MAEQTTQKRTCVEIRLTGHENEVVAVNRWDRAEAEQIAEQVRQTGRFNGFKAKVLRVFQW